MESRANLDVPRMSCRVDEDQARTLVKIRSTRIEDNDDVAEPVLSISETFRRDYGCEIEA